MRKNCKLIIGGDSAFAEIAYEYFTHDSAYEVVAFTVESEYLKRETLFGLPVVPFETLEKIYSPAEHRVYAAMVYTQLNRLRTRMSLQAKAKGYNLASYVSSRAFVWSNVEIGEHCFIFEDNTVQPFVKLGNNIVLWSGNHIGHHSKIGDHCFVSSHVVVSGFCDIGPNCFLGVNATIGNNVTLGADSFLGAGAVVVKDVPADTLVRGNLSDLSKPLSARRFSKVPSE